MRVALSVMALCASCGWARSQEHPTHHTPIAVAQAAEAAGTLKPDLGPLQQAAVSADKPVATGAHHGRSGVLWALPLASAAGAGLAWLLVRLGRSQRGGANRPSELRRPGQNRVSTGVSNR